VQLRLVVDAGSVLEDDDQSGAAHFLEHMLFNGTERWPGNELVTVLERFGTQFGPDVNAFTSFDETVYQLQVATDDDELVDTAFDVLAEWAARAAITQEDVEAERGVVVEEWRLRDQGVNGRIGAQIERLLLEGTPYAARDPIGDVDALRATDAAELRRFYDDWYRPDLMAVIAVGDLDADRMEEAIVDRFGDLEARSARERPEIAVSLLEEPSIVSFVDPELPTAFAEILYPVPFADPGSFGAARDRIATELAFDMVVRRLDEDVASGVADFFSAGYVVVPVVRALTASGIEIDADPEDLGPAVLAILTEVERIRRHGFGAEEFARVRDDRLALAEQILASQGTRQDVEFADRLVAHHLTGEPLPDSAAAFDLERRVLDLLTLDDVQSQFLALVDAAAPAVLVVGPDEFARAIPNERQLGELVVAVATGDVPPRDDTGPPASALMERPDAVEPTDRSTDASGATWLTFENGARVGLLDTTINENTVVFGAASPGGVSVVDRDDVVEAFGISEIVAQSGLAGFDRVELGRVLSGRVVSAFPFIADVEEGFFGDAAAEDLETLFQLVHLTMTDPRGDQTAVDTYVGQVAPFAADPGAIPGLATNQALFESRYGADNPYYSVLPSVEDLETFDLEAGMDVFRDRFGDAGDFVFVFVGDFSVREGERLAAAYVGTLPATGREDGYVDRQPDPPEGAVTTTVRAGEDQQAAVTFLVTGELEATPEDRVYARLLELVLTNRLRDRLREALAATYSPIVSVGLVDRPDALIETFIQISGDPERLDEISTETLAALEDLAANGPTGAELTTARQQLLREFELFSNELWVEFLLFYARHPEESVLDIFERTDVVSEAAIGDVQALAQIALPVGQYIEVRQLPAGS
jgi:zinc protease